MQIEVAFLGWRRKNKRIKCYRAREGEGRPGGGGGGGGGEETLYTWPEMEDMNEYVKLR